MLVSNIFHQSVHFVPQKTEMAKEEELYAPHLAKLANRLIGKALFTSAVLHQNVTKSISVNCGHIIDPHNDQLPGGLVAQLV